MVDGHTTVGFRVRSTHRIKHRYDVGLLLPNKVHHRAAHNIDKSEVSDIDRYKYKIDRSAETDATGYKGTENEC